MMMRHLLWKDAQTIKSLVYAIGIGIVAFNLLLVLLSFLSGEPSREWVNGFVSIWVLMPNLVALGAPALLVGSEEESGTLNWLRTLPVSWQKIVDAKFLVSLAAVIVTWVGASLMLMLILAASPSGIPPYSRELLSFTGVLHLLFFSVLLLITGFATAYLFRSPVSALIALIPTIAIVHAVALEFGHWILMGDLRSAHHYTPIPTPVLITLIVAALVALFAAWIAQRLLGRRRLTQMQRTRTSRFLGSSSVAAEAYRPPARAGSGRPSVVAALLWQQCRQMIWPGAMLTIVMTCFIVLHFTVSPSPSRRANSLQAIAVFAPLVIGLGACWLGTLVFYGDNVRRRFAFFADRGIAPTKVWWTRLLLPSLCVAFLVAVSVVCTFIPKEWNNHTVQGPPWLFPYLLFVGFAFGQLIGQWVQRPTLSFFGAPVYALASSMILFFVLGIYPTYAWSVLLVVPVLLFASWRLTSRWLAEKINFGFHWRVLAYTALATLIPVLVVFGHRYWTTPALMSQWRAEMLAMQDRGNDSLEINPTYDLQSITWDALPGTGTMTTDPGWTLKDYDERLQKELADKKTIGKFIGFDDVDDLLRYGDPAQYRQSPALEELFQRADRDEIFQVQRQAVAFLLKLATAIRELEASGQHTTWRYQMAADLAESKAVRNLQRLTKNHGATPELAQLVAKIPSDELRLQSRRRALITDWINYQSSPWKPEPGKPWYGKQFMHQFIGDTVSWIPLERTRADRFIDLFTRRLLRQLDEGLPAINSVEHRQTQRLLAEAVRPKWELGEEIRTNFGWDNDTEKHIAALRERYAGVPTQ